MFWQYKMFL